MMAPFEVFVGHSWRRGARQAERRARPTPRALAALVVLFVGACASDVEDLHDAGSVPVDARTSVEPVADSGVECCTDLGCPSCNGGLHRIGGCGAAWCGPPFPVSCPTKPEPCPVCAELDATSCPVSPMQNVLGCSVQECLAPDGALRFAACVEVRALSPPQACD